MTRKHIGIVGYACGENWFGAAKTYLEWVSQYGNVSIIMPWEDIKDDLDLIVLPGGYDMAPDNYGAVPGYATSPTDVHKEYFYKHKLPHYIANKVPVFGICLGFQQLCAFFGSKLTQDMPFHPQSPDRWETAHSIHEPRLKPNKDDIMVNSHHHQGVLVEDIHEDLEVLYVSEGGHVVEAMKHKDLPVAAVQWHPEELYDPVSDEIIKSLLV